MEERMGEAFAGIQQLTVFGKHLHPGETTRLLPELSPPCGYGRPHGSTIRFGRPGAPAQRSKQFETTCLPGGDAAVGSALCSIVTGCVHLHRKHGPAPDASTLAGSTGVLHRALLAYHSVQFGQDYGVWIKEWPLLQRSVFVIDRDDRIFYVEYVADQMSEPDYASALKAVHHSAVEG